MQSFNREFTLCIWHRRSSNCGEMFANNSGNFKVNVWFQVKVRFNLSNGRGQKGQAQWIYIRLLGRCCWAAKSLTRSQSGWRRKALPNKRLDRFTKLVGTFARTSQLTKRDSNASNCCGTASICSGSKTFLQDVTRISKVDNTLSTLLTWANHISALWEQRVIQTLGLRR